MNFPIILGSSENLNSGTTLYFKGATHRAVELELLSLEVITSSSEFQVSTKKSKHDKRTKSKHDQQYRTTNVRYCHQRNDECPLVIKSDTEQ